jgi:uncharacterized protein YfaT (DUF1175 family)
MKQQGGVEEERGKWAKANGQKRKLVTPKIRDSKHVRQIKRKHNNVNHTITRDNRTEDKRIRRSNQ